MHKPGCFRLGIGLLIYSIPLWAASGPAPVEGDFKQSAFQFESGESLPELNQHYRTLGTVHRGKDGKVDNAILVLHGLTGSGTQLLSETFAPVLFGAGQLLDATKYYIIMPDAIGHGGTSKPSNGLRARFPKYNLSDMVQAQYLLVTKGLGIDHLRLILGTSMGGQHGWIWGEKYPEFMDALMILACVPVETAGRNRMTRRMIIDAIRNDPTWKKGEYREPPYSLNSAIYTLIMMGSAPVEYQSKYPTAALADQAFDAAVSKWRQRLETNDLLFQIEASRTYNPSPDLHKIQAPLVAVNSADDQINPPELGIMEKEIKKVKNGKFVLLPISPQTHGHGTYIYAEAWKTELEALLRRSGS